MVFVGKLVASGPMGGIFVILGAAEHAQTMRVDWYLLRSSTAARVESECARALFRQRFSDGNVTSKSNKKKKKRNE